MERRDLHTLQSGSRENSFTSVAEVERDGGRVAPDEGGGGQDKAWVSSI